MGMDGRQYPMIVNIFNYINEMYYYAFIITLVVCSLVSYNSLLMYNHLRKSRDEYNKLIINNKTMKRLLFAQYERFCKILPVSEIDPKKNGDRYMFTMNDKLCSVCDKYFIFDNKEICESFLETCGFTEHCDDLTIKITKIKDLTCIK